MRESQFIETGGQLPNLKRQPYGSAHAFVIGQAPEFAHLLQDRFLLIAPDDLLTLCAKGG